MEALRVRDQPGSRTGVHEHAAGRPGSSRRNLGPRVDGRLAAGGGQLPGSWFVSPRVAWRRRPGPTCMTCDCRRAPHLPTHRVAPVPPAASARTDGGGDATGDERRMGRSAKPAGLCRSSRFSWSACRPGDRGDVPGLRTDGRRRTLTSAPHRRTHRNQRRGECGRPRRPDRRGRDRRKSRRGQPPRCTAGIRRERPWRRVALLRRAGVAPRARWSRPG